MARFYVARNVPFCIVTGNLLISSQVFRLFNYVGAFGTVVLLFEIIYACFTLYFLIHALKKLKKEKLKYFKSFWNKLEFALLAFSVACIVMYAFKHVLTSLAIDDLHESGSSKTALRTCQYITTALWHF